MPFHLDRPSKPFNTSLDGKNTEYRNKRLRTYRSRLISAVRHKLPENQIQDIVREIQQTKLGSEVGMYELEILARIEENKKAKGIS